MIRKEDLIQNPELRASGFKLLLIDKLAGMTSHDVVDQVRKIFAVKRVGHGGTLDPFATGLLLVAVGRETTKRLSQIAKLDKEYEATLQLGAESTTGDTEGEIALNVRGPMPNVKKVRGVLKSFLGKQKQIPPMYSAKKVKGKKLYQLAREGKEIERKPVEIEVKKLEILNYQWPHLKIRALVSSGTYMRVLAQDIGKALGSSAYLTELRRTKIGRFNIKNAISLDEL